MRRRPTTRPTAKRPMGRGFAQPSPAEGRRSQACQPAIPLIYPGGEAGAHCWFAGGAIMFQGRLVALMLGACMTASMASEAGAADAAKLTSPADGATLDCPVGKLHIDVEP